MSTPTEHDVLPEPSSSTSHLSYPSTLAQADLPELVAQQPRQLLKDRLYVGNLHSSVDEYTLIQVFSKYGKISHLDFLFHKTGALKGKPRGYAFVQYANPDDALTALDRTHDKLLRGRKITVTLAHQAPLDPGRRRGIGELAKPTTLSLLKEAESRGKQGTSNKIAKMEAKLRELEASDSLDPRPNALHPSLPRKPAFQPAPPRDPASRPAASRPSKPPTPASTLAPKPLPPPSLGSALPFGPPAGRKAAIAGVRIGKPKVGS